MMTGAMTCLLQKRTTETVIPAEAAAAMAAAAVDAAVVGAGVETVAAPVGPTLIGDVVEIHRQAKWKTKRTQ